MITSFLLGFALQTATPEEYGRAIPVDFDHEHEWVKLDAIEGGSVWWDKNSITRAWKGEQVYPVILMRAVFDPGASPIGKIDRMNAVDCERNQFGSVKGLTIGHPRALKELPDFGPWPKPDSEEVRSMMRAVCGEDWTP